MRRNGTRTEDEKNGRDNPKTREEMRRVCSEGAGCSVVVVKSETSCVRGAPLSNEDGDEGENYVGGSLSQTPRCRKKTALLGAE